METKYYARDKKIRTNVRINCPDHGIQNCYVVYGVKNKKEIEGVGCGVCFESLSIKDEAGSGKNEVSGDPSAADQGLRRKGRDR